MAFFADLLSPPPTFVNVFPISLGKKCPVSHSSQWSVTCRVREKEAFRRAGNARFPRQGHTCGRSIWEDGQLPAAGQTPGNSFGRDGAQEVSAIAEAPCSVCPSAPMSGFGHAACRSGRKRTPGRDSPCAKVQAQDGESPFTHVRDCRGKPDPKGNARTTTAKTAFKHTIEKKEDRIFRSFALMIYICN